MLYGILLESVRDGICTSYGNQVWKKLVQELNLRDESFTILGRYEDNLISSIAECLAYILDEGTTDSHMLFFGQCFVRFFTNYGYDQILRVAGRHFRNFLHAIDQLHDSTKFSFPKMKSPLFHVFKEDQNGVLLQYQSRRRGFEQYIIGQLKESATQFYNTNISVRIDKNLSTNEYTVIIFRVDFDNSVLKETSERLNKIVTLPDIASETFLKVFPFNILIDPSMRIFNMGKSIENLFPRDTNLNGRHLDQIFTLIRPDILLIWDNLLYYGPHIVFLMETTIPLRFEKVNNSNEDPINTKSEITPNSTIRLKGQMKWINKWNIIAFLCHPILTTTEEMTNVGLTLDDLNSYDGSSETLVSGMQHARQLQLAIDKQQAWISKLHEAKVELEEWKRKGKRLLYSMMPHHIAEILEQGVVPNSICESHKMVTVLFCYTLDFKDLLQNLSPIEIVECINQMVIDFDHCTEKYDVFKVETKADASYMIVSGIEERSKQRRISTDGLLKSTELHREGKRTSGEVSENICSSSSSAQRSSLAANGLNDKKLDSKNPLGLNQVEIVAGLALDLLKESKKQINKITKVPYRIKIGFHSGPAVGGIVGNKTYQYCLFGDTINTASRVTTTSDIEHIHLSVTSWQLLQHSTYFITIPRGKIEMKGKGEMQTYWLTGATEDYKKQGSNLERKSDVVDMNVLSDFHLTINQRNEKRSSLSNVINRLPSDNGQCPFTNFKTHPFI